MTICEVDLTEKGRILLKGNKKASLTIQFDPTLWAVTTDYPSTEGMEYSSFKTKWAGQKVQRIVFTKTALEQKGKNAFTITKH